MQFLKKYANFLALGCAIIAAVLFFVTPILTSSYGNTDSMIKGIINGADSTTMVLVTFIVIVAAAVLVGLSIKYKNLALIAILVLLVAIVFTFLTKNFVVADSIRKAPAGYEEAVKAGLSIYSLGAGIIISGVLSILSLCFMAIKKFVK